MSAETFEKILMQRVSDSKANYEHYETKAREHKAIHEGNLRELEAFKVSLRPGSLQHFAPNKPI